MGSNPPKTSLTGSGNTDWFDLSGVATDAVFIVSGTGSAGTISVRYSDVRGTKLSTDYVTDPTVIPVAAAGEGPYAIPFGTAKFAQFVGSGVAGTVQIGWGPAKNARGDLMDIGVE